MEYRSPQRADRQVSYTYQTPSGRSHEKFQANIYVRSQFSPRVYFPGEKTWENVTHLHWRISFGNYLAVIVFPFTRLCNLT